MKYVSPVCEVEVLETEDIMNVPSTNVAGVTVFGGVDAVDHNNSGAFDVTETVWNEETQEYEEVVIEGGQGAGFGLSLDYNLLNG